MSVKIAHISSVHPVNDSRVFYRECISLSKAGYQVHLVGLGDHTGDIRHSVVEGVQVTAMPRPSSRFRRLLRTIPAVYRQARKIDASIYHLHDPEMVPVGTLLRLQGKKVIFDVHEYFPGEAYGKPYLPKWAQHIAAFTAHGLLWLANKSMSAIIPVHKGIVSSFPGQRIAIVENFPEYDDFAPSDSITQPAYDDRPPVVVFSGALNSIRSPREIIGAFGNPDIHPDVRLRIVGKVTEKKLEQELRDMPGWSRVDYHGWVEPYEVGAKVADARAGLVIYYPTPNHLRDAQPRKLFEYMAAGLPVIASDFPHWRRLIGEVDCGILVDPLDSDAIAHAINWILEHPQEAAKMGERGQEAARTRYNWSSEKAKLLELYEELSKEIDK